MLNSTIKLKLINYEVKYQLCTDSFPISVVFCIQRNKEIETAKNKLQAKYLTFDKI